MKSYVSPSRSQFFRTKEVSNSALCATRYEPDTKSRNLGSTVSIGSASITMSSVIEVSCVILNGIGKPGFTKAENLSTIAPSLILTAPNSIILSETADRPVVSRSNTTQVLSIGVSSPSVPTHFFRSSTR